ncbi:MAG: 8-oxo-dGTP pyrophosphatase MutT (NUDIX family) [Gammaproteobacteria bacterium]|jgi:8-oxo-dGTP pyrophosphatase MutT (NUDIX family)
MTNLIQQRLARHSARKIPWRSKLTRSAVATVIYVDEFGKAEVLLMQRANRSGDPWSGDICYPGGRMQTEDKSALDTAQREMLEEVGIDISQAGRLVARLSDVVTREHSRTRPMIVTPYVYVVDKKPYTSASAEAVASFWCPLEFFENRDNRERMTWSIGRSKISIPLSMPCYFYQDKRIWGLTLIMVDELVAVASGKGNSHYLND